MANTIKHKRGSGSDPAASSLSVGELAIRTDTGVVFTKKDDGTVAEIAGGGETNLGVSTTSTAVTVTSDTGNNATISEASSSAAGVMSAAHHDKLDGIASGATANSTESIQDIVGGMVSGNSESGISVTYQDGDGTLDFSVTSQTDNNFTTTLKNKLDGIAAGAEVNVATNLSKTTTTTTNVIASSTGTNVTLNEATGSAAGLMSTTHHNKLDGIASGATANSTESIQDIVGGMVSGNSESGISVTYQDSDGTLDFSVSSQTDNNFTTTLKNKLDGIASGATNVTNNNQLTNGAGYITSTLTNEQVQDIVGGMVTGNTETGITVTYQDSDGTLDFVVGDVSATVASGCIYENSQTISSNYSITSGKNAMSAGPITIASGVTVTVTSGSTYTIV